jgi:prepilin-type processing-associated H-X9-DG protein/prepilin-type N-terminal cleavage/methylation domain-containing protein
MTIPPRRIRAGFTAIELMMVIGVVALLAALVVPAVFHGRKVAHQTQCSSNLHQIGLGMIQFAQHHNGNFPKAVGHAGAENEDSWVYTLKPYLDNCDKVRICPDDPKRDDRLATRGTSYVLNGWIADTRRGAVTNLERLPNKARTITVFEGADQRSLAITAEHVHSYNWFNTTNRRNGTSWQAITGEIQVDRHQGAANYLYADGHVESITAESLKSLVDQGTDFSLPPKF